MPDVAEQSILDFYTYPPIGGDDWRYGYQTAEIRAMELQMLSSATLVDMANAEDFEQAADFLSSSEYALPQGGRSFAELQDIFKLRRTAARKLFSDLMLDKPVAELFKTRDDFANLRLAVRRMLTEKPLGSDYSDEGNFPAELFAKAFEEEGHSIFPDYMQEAADRAVLGYYQNKDIRQVDYAIDASQAEYNLARARELKSIFLLGLFKIQIDLTNIRTMLRLKLAESEQRDVFLHGGFIGLERLKNGLETSYEGLGQLFFSMPHHRVVETGAGYVASNRSFLKAEQQCEDYLMGFLKTTGQITAGPQPIIAYLLTKENEIRTVRLILTAKKNSLDKKLILDRIS